MTLASTEPGESFFDSLSGHSQTTRNSQQLDTGSIHRNEPLRSSFPEIDRSLTEPDMKGGPPKRGVKPVQKKVNLPGNIFD